MNVVLVIASGYVVGSVPFAYLVTRRRGLDLREIGSGNVGAANVLRTSGVALAAMVMLLDMLKGSLAVVAAQAMMPGTAAPVAAGLAAILGHVYPVWLGFRGGKGVATAAGVFAVLTPIALAIAGAVFVITIWATRYISAGSLAAAIVLAIAASMTKAPSVVVAAAVCAAALVVYWHRSNLARLVAGTERRVGLRLFHDRRT